MGREISAPALFQLGYYWEAKIFLTSVRLDIYTALAKGPKSAAEIAQAVNADTTSLARLLDALVAIGLLTRQEMQYANTPTVAEFLVKTSPFYLGELMLLQDEEWEHWGRLEKIVQTGRPNITGNIFMNRPEIGELVLKVLHRMGQRVAPILSEKIDLSPYQTLLDVGGGAGTFSLAFCKRYPNLSATLFDLPQTLLTTKKHLDEEKMADRIQLVGGDFNKDLFPGIYDVVFLSDILHYQTSEENAALIQKLYRATKPGGKIIVKDMLINPEVSNPGWNAIFSIHLLVYTEKGRCFPENEVRGWMEQAGFHSIVEVERNTVLTAVKSKGGLG